MIGCSECIGCPDGVFVVKDSSRYRESGRFVGVLHRGLSNAEE